MNVVHVFPYSAGISGGHSNAIRGFIACQRHAGINAVGLSAKPIGSRDEFPGMEVESLWDLRWETIVQNFEFQPNASLVNFHSITVKFRPLIRSLRRAQVPYVVTSHGQLDFNTPLHWLKKFLYLHLVHGGPRQAAGLQVLTKLAVRRLRLLLPTFREPTLVQGNVVALPDAATGAAPTRSEFRIPTDAFVLAFLGRLDVQHKGLDRLMKAFSRLPSDRAWLILAGPDWEGGAAHLDRLAERLKCRQRVLLPGPVYNEKKWSLLKSADVFVSPSRWEAFGIAQVEAMMLGLPVVTSTNGNLALELHDAGAAVVVPPEVEPLARAISALETDSHSRRDLGARGKAWAEEHCNLELGGRRFKDFYDSVLRSHGAKTDS